MQITLSKLARKRQSARQDKAVSLAAEEGRGEAESGAVEMQDKLVYSGWATAQRSAADRLSKEGNEQTMATLFANGICEQLFRPTI